MLSLLYLFITQLAESLPPGVVGINDNDNDNNATTIYPISWIILFKRDNMPKEEILLLLLFHRRENGKIKKLNNWEFPVWQGGNKPD